MCVFTSIMNVQRQLTSAAIRTEAQRYEGVKVQLNKLFRLVELVGDPHLKSNIKTSLSIVRGTGLGLSKGAMEGLSGQARSILLSDPSFKTLSVGVNSSPPPSALLLGPVNGSIF